MGKCQKLKRRAKHHICSNRSEVVQGNVVKGHATVTAGSFLEMRPATGVAWAIHTLFAGFVGAELYLTDGTNNILIQSFAGRRYVTNLVHRATHDVWLKLKNNDSVTRNLGYTGVETGLGGTSVGDAVLVMSVVYPGEVLDIRPAGSSGIILTNIYFDSNYTLEFVDDAGSLSTEVAADDTSLPGDVPSLLDLTIELTNNNYFRITNIDAVDPYPFGYSGYYIQ